MELRSYGSQVSCSQNLVPHFTYIGYLFQFLADLRYHLTKTAYMSSTESCCTPAVLFRASSIPKIVSKLVAETKRSARIGHAKDHILDESKFVGRQTDMNLVVHIGSYSSVRKRRINLHEVIDVRR
ncbi:unnamed protein product [Strongylus vulgaris]|uniref:Uncharacterized protein n=1 Tax=Strongylus vulgaris TaxID=40348 RepID=A0A3P7IWB1_STRVU|nr:unnamed protein product [Strongylus vulgaris]